MKHALQANRRQFLKTSAATAASLAVLNPSAWVAAAEQKSEVFRFAQIGCGGKGDSDLSSVESGGAKLVAMCDVDSNRAKGAFQKHASLPKYTDYRKMLDEMENEIDGVVVSTPDHTHAVAATDAIRRGMHAYVQKPLARTYDECQVLHDAAIKHGVVTQMGNQGHAGSGLKLWQAMMDADAFGEIKEVHCWSDRPIWAQGMTSYPGKKEIPSTLDWNAWQGPVARRDFGNGIVPFAWRGWWEYGCGAMGDMACHNMDPAFWILHLGMPSKVVAKASAPATIAYPEWSVIEFTFPATDVYPHEIKLFWHDGKKMPPSPEGYTINSGNGCMVMGSKLTAMGGSHASPPKVIAVEGSTNAEAVAQAQQHWSEVHKTLRGSNHYHDWVNAAKAHDPSATETKFSYAAPMTQAILVGCVALRFPEQTLEFDAASARFSNSAEASEWLRFKPLNGYDLKF